MEWHRYRYKTMNEYFLDLRRIRKLIEPVLPTREEYTKTIIDRDPFDTSKFPTHRIMNPDGSYSYHYGASKHFTLVDPETSDRHSLHYAPGHRVYMLLKNRKTGEWEFPTQIMRERQTVLEAKNEIVDKITGKQWQIKHSMVAPLISTLRDFNDEEKRKVLYLPYHGVRCFYFLACHKAGVPALQQGDYEDFAWVAKREMNKFLPEDAYREFINILADT